MTAPGKAAGPRPTAHAHENKGRAMSTVLAVIPARGGSKGVPGKNLAPVGDTPLVGRAIRSCRDARLVTGVVVSTDDPGIAAAAHAGGAEVVERPTDIAGDMATSEDAVLHAMRVYEERHGRTVDVVLLVQCTSPFITREEIDGVTAAVLDGADSALTVAPFHGFIWREGDAEGQAADAHGVNHDKSFRPRRQDRPQDLLETGSAYAMRAAGFRDQRHRFFGRTELVRTDPARVLEIDDPHDLARARALSPLFDGKFEGKFDGTLDRRSGGAGAATPPPAFPEYLPDYLPSRSDIDAVVLDFDGTQTDDRVLVDSDGRELVAVHRGDGLGVAALRRAGVPLLILSTEENPVVAARARKLRVPVLHGVERKDLALKQWCEEQGIAPERVLYAGNDVNDLPVFDLVGWPVAVGSAHDVVRGAARAVTSAPGGAGAIREIASWILGKELTTS